jgi:hypothetical protein
MKNYRRICKIALQRPWAQFWHPAGSLASLSHLISGQLSILAPGGQVGYRVSLASGQSAGAQTALDGFGESLFALQTGINSLLAILTRFGAGSPSKAVAVMNDALGDAACADAMGAGNAGAILASCLSPKDMAEYFGTAGVLLAPLAAAGGLADFFASEFQSLHDVWTHADQYTIVINAARLNPTPQTPSCSQSAIADAAQQEAAQYRGTIQDIQNFQCSGNFAYAIADEKQSGNINSVTLLFRDSGGKWIPADRGTYCVDGSVPSNIYNAACQTQ